MTSPDRTLFIWSEAGRVDLEPIKQAKLALGLGYRVVPASVSELEPPPPEARILAVGSRPPWVHDYALTGEHTSPEGWQRALRWVLHEVDEDPKATTVLDILRSIFPPTEHGELREISPEELESERKLLEYVGRR